jgi:hypothetical protein
MYSLGQILPWEAKGDFTFYKYISTLDRNQLEDKLGFHKGRLKRGAVIVVMYCARLASFDDHRFHPRSLYPMVAIQIKCTVGA